MTEQKIQEQINYVQNIFINMDRIEQAKILEEITAAIAAYVRSENVNSDAGKGIFYALGEVAESLQEDFQEFLGISNDKHVFLSRLTKIFTLLLNTNVSTV